LATPKSAAAQRKKAITRAERRTHRVLNDGEPAQRPPSLRMVSAHALRVG
jgi:hypothetical protein